MKDKPKQEPVHPSGISGQMPPKMLVTDGSERDPIVVYKLYAQKRPEKKNEDDSLFYLAVNNNLKAESLQTKEWFKVGPVGTNLTVS